MKFGLISCFSFSLLLNVLLSCKNKSADESSYKSTVSKKNNRKSIGTEIVGDFNGDGIFESAKVKHNKIQNDEMDDGRAMEYSIEFSYPEIKPMKSKFYEILLINEGDLNNDGADEISIFQNPENGYVNSLATYSYVNNNWKETIEMFLIPTDCEELSEEELQGKIFKENGKIYRLETNPSTDPFSIVKQETKLY
jgi:hypothetical protein